MEAVNLVPGDVVVMKFGDIVAADVKLFSDDPQHPFDSHSEEVPMQVRMCSNHSCRQHSSYSPYLAQRHPFPLPFPLPFVMCCYSLLGLAFNSQIDQAALTGESLPAKKHTGDVAFSGSAIKAGERHAVVYATGINTFFGRCATPGSMVQLAFSTPPYHSFLKPSRLFAPIP